jgi:hypothetical protein
MTSGGDEDNQRVDIVPPQDASIQIVKLSSRRYVTFIGS